MEKFIRAFVREFESREETATTFGEPIVAFADAEHPYIRGLKELVSGEHLMPSDVMSEAKSVICYYVPFTPDLAKSNVEGTMASPRWARAYEELNALFSELNERICLKLAEEGYKGATSARATSFDREKLISDWSQRHIAYAAGLGTFGMNNMLITEKGCCGRYSSVVTDKPYEYGRPRTEEFCLYKKSGGCGICMKNCPAGAILPSGYDRKKCFALCTENAAIHKSFGNSYGAEGSQVCGKCITGSPCAFRGF
ncbi:MAG: epoxyqueuosine reductase [Firmicutes bacterium]|nr:epoxyqueuosine reductase [Bacillota bacterium]